MGLLLEDSIPEVMKRGNPLGLRWQKHSNCKICAEEKCPAGLRQLHHGSSCHFCWNRLQFFCRKFGIKHISVDALTDLQRGHVISESKSLRDEFMAKKEAKAARGTHKRGRSSSPASSCSDRKSKRKSKCQHSKDDKKTEAAAESSKAESQPESSKSRRAGAKRRKK